MHIAHFMYSKDIISQDNIDKMRKTDFLDKWINGYKLIETKDGDIYKLTEYKLEWHGVLKFCEADGVWKKTSLSNIKDLKNK